MGGFDPAAMSSAAPITGGGLARVTMADDSVANIDYEILEDDTASIAIEEAVHLARGDLVPGTRYRIVQWLGEGGMGVVYECEHIDIERRVALKILRERIAKDPLKVDMFRQEARAVSLAASKGSKARNVVEIYDFDTLPDGRKWFAMELLAGSSLASSFSREPMSPARLIGILRQVCKGLDAAHEAGVVHRDIKPGNIMLLRKDKRDDFVKIVDFGVAAMLSGAGRHRIQLEGTPIYMAPEQARGEPCDRTVDVYAVGAMAFHLLAGRPPFFGTTVLEVLRKVRSEPAPTIAQRNPEVQIPIALERVIQRCLEKDRARRYPDMRELEAALCEAQIASKLVTAWDDLPLPEVAPERYAVLKRAYETATRPRASPRALWLPIAAAAALVLGFALVVFIGLNDARDTSKGAGPVQEHVELAHAAAARAFYVYPPADDPAEPTAYREVVALEGLEGELQPPAVEAAQALRQEFGETLTRLGDQYWGRDGGRIFAVDYYINALLFDPDNARARERAPITPGELLALRHKAETGEFSHAELTASAPLVALAEPDDDKRFEKLKELEQEPSLSGSRREGHIAKLIEHEAQSTPAGLKRARRPAPTPTPPVEPEPELLPLETTDVAHAAQTKPAPKNTGPSAHDRDRAMELALSGHALLQRGKRAPAEQKFNQALALNHRNHVALAGLAHIHYDRADYGRSVRYASRAVALAPSKSSYRIVRGDAYFKVYRYKEAEREYAKAKSLGHPDAGTRLAKVEAKLRD